MARYDWAVRWARRQDRGALASRVRALTDRFEKNPRWVTPTDKARLAAGRLVLGLSRLDGLPDVKA